MAKEKSAEKSFADQENIKRIYDFWKTAIPEIKKQSFSRDQVINIKRDFLEQILSKSLVDELLFKDYRLSLLQSELNIALEIAYSNYRKENPGFWRDVFGGIARQLPSLAKQLPKMVHSK